MSTSNQAGKGDKPRPVNKAVFDENFSNIDWNCAKSDKEIKQTKQSSKKITYKY